MRGNRLLIKTLPSGKDTWTDKDVVMLHAVFQVVVNFVEQERPFDIEARSHSKKQERQIMELYNWWQDYERLCQESFDKHLGGPDEELSRIENKMLRKAIALRHLFWT